MSLTKKVIFQASQAKFITSLLEFEFKLWRTILILLSCTHSYIDSMWLYLFFILAVPPNRPTIFDAKRRDRTKLVEPYNEGSNVLLICEVEGGKFWRHYEHYQTEIWSLTRYTFQKLFWFNLTEITSKWVLFSFLSIYGKKSHFLY